MLPTKPLPSEQAYGHLLIIITRWILIVAGLFLTLMVPGPMVILRTQILVILLLSVANFYLCAQVLTRKPIQDLVAYGVCAADIAVITTSVILQGGFESNTFIYYFPAFLAFSVALPTFLLVAFAGGALSLYAFISLITLPVPSTDFQTLIIRLLMLTAVAVCGHQYWSMERRHQQALTARTALALHDTPLPPMPVEPAAPIAPTAPAVA